MKVFYSVASTLMAATVFATSCNDKLDNPFNWLPENAVNAVVHECTVDTKAVIKEAVFNLSDFQSGYLNIKYHADDGTELEVSAPNSLAVKDGNTYRWNFNLREYPYTEQANMPTVNLVNPVFGNVIYGPYAPSYSIESDASYNQTFNVITNESNPIYTLDSQMLFSANGLNVRMLFGSGKNHIRPEGQDFVMPDMRGSGNIEIKKQFKSEKQISKVTYSEDNGIYSYTLYLGDEDSYVTFVVSGEKFGKTVTYRASAAESNPSVVPGISRVEKGEDYFFAEGDGAGHYLVKHNLETGSVTLALNHKSKHESIAFYYSGQVEK